MSRKRRIQICVVIIVAVILVGFYAYISLRGGRDYTEELAALLPPDTALYLSLRDFASMLDQIKSFQVYRELQEGPELMDYLLSTKSWRSLDRRIDKLERKTRIQITETFLTRWFGRHVVFAVLAGDEGKPPPLLLLSKTAVGFEEKFAEFIAQLYPELKLKTESYRGVAINTYQAKKEKNAFSYLRFGRTVVVLFRSRAPGALKDIVDRRDDHSRQNLAGLEGFRSAFRGREKESGIVAYADARGIISLLFSGLKTKPDSDVDRFALLHRTIAAIKYVSASIRLKDGVTADLKIAHSALAAEDEGTSPPRALGYLPSRTLGFVVWRDRALRESFRYLLDVIDEYSLARGDVPLSTQIEHAIGVNLRDDVLPLMGDEIAFSFRNIRPFIAYPVPQVEIMLESVDKRRTELVLRRVLDYLQRGGEQLTVRSERVENSKITFVRTLVGAVGYAIQDGYLLVALDKDLLHESLKVRARKMPGIGENANYKLLEGRIGASADFIAFIDLDATSKALESVSQQTLAWKPKQRLRLESYKKLADVLRYGKAALLAAERKADGTYARITIPLE